MPFLAKSSGNDAVAIAIATAIAVDCALATENRRLQVAALDF